MKDKNLLGPWIRRFLLEHLVAERNLSRNTQASYRDTLALLLPFASKLEGCAIDRMAVEDLTPEVVRNISSWTTWNVLADAALRPAINGLRLFIHWHASSACVRRSTWPGVPR
ncbi:site-specific integrase [Sinorhizobium medicae]|uniref:site-specific integrase n=1 Tax=Sinorhizobium medicae TaxID=110321 RepID=UPI001F173FA4|nr:site-specific integrase [Sinorhizobium medicae]